MRNEKRDPIHDYLKESLQKHSGPEDGSNKIKIKTGGDYVGRDQHHEINHIHQSRLLTKDERRKLNNLVKQLTEDYGESGKQTWTSIHRILGLDNIEDMHLDHYKPAEAILQLLLENAELRAAPSAQENCTALRSLLRKTNAALQTNVSRNVVLEAEINLSRQVNTELESCFHQQTTELRNTESKLQQALAAAKLSSAPCAQCNITQKTLTHQRKRLLVSITIATLATASAIFFALKTQAQTVQIKVADAHNKLCQFEGTHYSVGSAMTQDLSHVRCTYQDNDKHLPPVWIATNPKPKTRVTRPKQPIRPNSAIHSPLEVTKIL